MPWCDRCGISVWDMMDHKDYSNNHWPCYDCGKDFASQWGLTQHYVQSPNHAYCQRCNEHFQDFDDLDDHYEYDHFYCRPCKKTFDSELGLHEHRRQKHFYCVSCKRLFQGQSQLDSHLRSSVHQPRTHACPGRNCGRAFVSHAHLVLHWESGACPSGVTRAHVDRYAVQRDSAHVITDARRLIAGPDGSYAAPSSAAVVDRWATAASWNGRAYECVLCHRTYRTLDALNAHLRSPAHADRIYKCPTLVDGCGKQFGTLSGLVQHVESGMCGVRRFQGQMRNLIDDVTTRMGMLTY